MSWYAVDRMAWERTRELEAAATRPQPTRLALDGEPPSISTSVRRPVLVTSDLCQDFGRVLAQPGRRTPDGRRSLV